MTEKTPEYSQDELVHELPQAEIVDRIEWLTTQCTGKRVIHVGFAVRQEDDGGDDDVGLGGHVPRLLNQWIAIAAHTTTAISAGARKRGIP